MVTRSTNGDGLLRSEPVHTPMPAVAETDPWAGWQAWLDGYLAIERNKTDEIFSDIYEAYEFTRGDLYKGLERLEKQVAELKGAIGVLKGLGPPPGICFRGAYDPNVDYSVHDVVAINCSSFIALRDRPGACPGEFWQLLAGKGDQGQVGPAGPRGEEGPRGKLPIVKLWTPETVYYAGDVVAYDGGTFQAQRDTGQPPSHAHWICLATAGRDGKTIAVRGTFDESVSYRRLDVVALNGGSFIALKDAPGPCPGPGWQLIASQGKRGVAGEKGDRGERGLQGSPGLSGATIREWKIDRERYVATPVMSDGRDGPPLELRGLFEQFLLEAR
jgi:hypothetical protein